MHRISGFAAVVALAVTSTAQGEALDFDPYTGTTTTSMSEATSSTYHARSTPSGETPAATPLGLTPGFWKQDQHYFAWVSYTKDQNYNAAFGVADTRTNMTLLEAMGKGGGAAAALGRHAVAALLNATSPHVNYRYTELEVIAMVRKAYETGNFEAIKDEFQAANEAGGEYPK